MLIGLVPQISGLEQVGHQTFPLAILKANEGEFVDSIRKMAEALLHWENQRFVGEKGQVVTLHFLICTDLSALWTSTGLDFDRRTEVEFCPHCYKKSCNIESWGSVGSRVILPGLNFLSSSFIYCSLHAGMRVTKLIELVAETLPSEKLQQRFKKCMKGYRISIKFDKEKTKNFIKVYLVGNWMKKSYFHVRV